MRQSPDAGHALADWLTRLEAADPSRIELGLDRVRQVWERLNVSLDGRTVITVGGTNGKGSCVATLEALLIAEGRRVGAYTSPHIHHFCERIRIQGVNAAEADVCNAFARIASVRDDTPLTYFEVATLAAMLVFAKENCDVLVLEVGLGGRLDAVNLFDAQLCVLTSIDLDHEAWLGNSRESIAREKAGILRAGVPLVLAERRVPVSLALRIAELGVPVWRMGLEFDVRGDTACIADAGAWQALRLPLVGSVLPPASIAAAMQALHILGLLPSTEQVEKVMVNLSLPGRMQRLAVAGRTWLFDVAHNPAAINLLLRRLGGWRPDAIIFAASADKDLPAMLASLRQLAAASGAKLYLPRLQASRAADPGALPGPTQNQGTPTPVQITFPDVASCVRALLAEPEQRNVLVCGSFFTVAEVQQALEAIPDIG